jgi:hypothetical protein
MYLLFNLLFLCRYEKKLDWLRNLLANTKEELRETVALLYGLVAAGLQLPDFEKAARDLSRGWKVRLFPNFCPKTLFYPNTGLFFSLFR